MLVVIDAVSKGYQIQELEIELQELGLQNQDLELRTRDAQSLEQVSRAVKMIGLVDSEQPQYIDSRQPSYALAE